MAEGTRLRDLNEHMTMLESKLQRLTTEYQDRVRELGNQINEVSITGQKQYEAIQVEATKRHESVLQDNANKHEELMKLLTLQSSFNKPNIHVPNIHQIPKEQDHKDLHTSHLRNVIDNKGKGILPVPPREANIMEDIKGNNKSYNSAHSPHPKLEFPTFSGENPRLWVENCEYYFEIYQTPYSQWLNIASMHLSGKARTWKQSFFIQRQGINWEEFVEALYQRFGQTGERYLVREFNSLKQFGTVESYQEKFEELRTQLLFHNPQLSEEHFISCYIGGLREDLIPFLDIAHPQYPGGGI